MPLSLVGEPISGKKERFIAAPAQFIAVCSSSILVETLGYAVSFSSPWRGKRRVFERCKPVFIDQLQPSTNSDKLSELFGFDHGVGHPLLLLYDAKAPNCQKNKAFKELGHYSEWPKVADAVIQAARPSVQPRTLPTAR